MTTTTLTADDLRQFTGTEHWYRHPLMRRVLYTDGVKYLAEQAGAYWLIDIIAFAQIDLAVKSVDFQAWTLTVHEDRSATLTCTDGNGQSLLRQSIPFTDFPLTEVTVWVEDRTILLPSEH